MVDGVGLTVIFDTTWPTPADLACDDSRCGTEHHPPPLGTHNQKRGLSVLCGIKLGC
jgi:hypothetical protein